jgi:hypothetical protein
METEEEFINGNREVLKRMRNGGDDLSKVRPVYHDILFPNSESRNDFKNEILKDGFIITGMTDDYDDEFQYELSLERNDFIKEPNIHDYTIYLWKLAIEHGGHYDGWYTERLSSS